MAKKNNETPLSESFTGKSLNQLFECLRNIFMQKKIMELHSLTSECCTGKSLNQ